MFETALLIAIVMLILFYGIHVFNLSMELSQRAIEKRNNLSSYMQRVDKIFQDISKQVDQGSSHEESLLFEITRSREGRISEMDSLATTISKVNARLEAYPNLYSLSMRKEFQNQIQQIEQNIQSIVEAYNQAAKDYNTFVLSFPASFFCAIFKRSQIDYMSALP